MPDAPEPPPPFPLTNLLRHDESLDIAWAPIAESPYSISATPIGYGSPSSISSESPACRIPGLTPNVNYSIQIIETKYTPLGPVPIPRDPFQVYTRPRSGISIDYFHCDPTEYGIRIFWDVFVNDLMPIGNTHNLRVMVGKKGLGGKFDYLPHQNWVTAPKYRLGSDRHFDFTRELENTYALRLVAVNEPPYPLNQAEFWGPSKDVALNCTYDHTIPHEGAKLWQLPQGGSIMGQFPGRYSG